MGGMRLSTGCAYAVVLSLATTLLLSPTLNASETGEPSPSDPPMPAFLADADGLEYRGQIGGLHAWTIPGSESLWFVAPDGRTTLVGHAFGPSGADVGAAYTGRRPVDLTGELLWGQADWELDGLLDDASDAEAPALQLSAGDRRTAPTSDLPLGPAMLPSDLQSELLVELVERLQAVETPEAYQEALDGWVRKVAELSREPGGSHLGPDSAVATEEMSTPLASRDTGPVRPRGAAKDTVPADETDQALQLLRRDAFWFGVGQFGVPTVYAVIDPMCPFCARAMRLLQDKVEGGELQLRVVLAPVVDRRSPGVIAGILSSEEPPIEFWRHEISKATSGRSELEPKPVRDLPPELQVGLQTNISVVDRLSERVMTGVPFFVWQTDEGARMFEGVPGSADVFGEALVDDFNGMVQNSVASGPEVSGEN